MSTEKRVTATATATANTTPVASIVIPPVTNKINDTALNQKPNDTTMCSTKAVETNSVPQNDAVASTIGGAPSPTTTESKDAAAEATADSVENEKREQAPEKKVDFTNWPLRNIKEPHPNDIMYGRGGGTNHHPGNKRYRKMVEDRKVDYVNCKRLDKPLVALEIINIWRAQVPPGRFLKQDDSTGLWNDVGDKKAREKTSQALREKAPQIRQELERERFPKGRGGESTDDEEHGPRRPGVVERDHSLGVELLKADEAIVLDGFSWQDTVASGSASTVQRSDSVGDRYAMPPPASYNPPVLTGSYVPYPPPPIPPTNGPYGDPTPSWGRYASWGSVPGPPPLPTSHAPPPPPGAVYQYPPVQSGGWIRDHSLGQNPLAHATLNQSAYPTAFDHRVHSGHCHPYPPSHAPPHSYPPHPQSPSGHPPPPHISSGHPAPPHPSYPPQAPPAYSYSNGPPPHPQPHCSPQPYRAPPPPPHSPPHTSSPSIHSSPKSAKSYSIDPVVASQWSGQNKEDIEKTLSTTNSVEERDTFRSTPTSHDAVSMSLSKPDVVKRHSSNQNETDETKQRIKRCNLNREGSVVSNRLKETYMPGYFDSKTEVAKLSLNFRQSSISAVAATDALPLKPSPLVQDDRMTTLDINALDLNVKPVSVGQEDRSLTIDALNFDEPLTSATSKSFDTSSVIDLTTSTNGSVVMPRPAAIENRFTTTDYNELVNEPLH